MENHANPMWPSRGYSYISEKEDLYIQHVRNGGEKRVERLLIGRVLRGDQHGL